MKVNGNRTENRSYPDALAQYLADVCKEAAANQRWNPEQKKQFSITFAPSVVDDPAYKNIRTPLQIGPYPTHALIVSLPGAFGSPVVIHTLVQKSSEPFSLSNAPLPMMGSVRTISAERIYPSAKGLETKNMVMGQYPPVENGGASTVQAVVLGISSRLNFIGLTEAAENAEEIRNLLNDCAQRIIWNGLAGINAEAALGSAAATAFQHMPETQFIGGYNHPGEDKKLGVDFTSHMWSHDGPLVFRVQVKANEDQLPLHKALHPDVSALVYHKKPASISKEDLKLAENKSLRYRLTRAGHVLLREDLGRAAQFYLATRKPFLEMQHPVLGWLRELGLSQTGGERLIESWWLDEDRYWFIRDRGEREERKRRDEEASYARRMRGVTEPPTNLEDFPFDSRLKVCVKGSNGVIGWFYLVGTPERLEKMQEVRPDMAERTFLLTNTIVRDDFGTVLSAETHTDEDRLAFRAMIERALGPRTYAPRTYAPRNFAQGIVPVSAKAARLSDASDDKQPVFGAKPYMLPTLETPQAKKNEFIMRASQWKTGNLPADLVKMAQNRGTVQEAKLLAVQYGLYTPEDLRDPKRFKNLPPYAMEARRELLAHHFPGEFEREP